MNDFNEKFRKRTKKFVLDIISLYRKLPKTEEARIIGRQILRSGSSVGSNFRAATRARSKNEYYAKMCIVVEETDETVFWLEIIEEAKILSKKELEEIANEANELLSIFAKTKKTLKNNK